MSSSGRRQLRLGVLGAVLAASLWAAAPAGARVLLVDASPPRHHEHGAHPQRYSTIQDAVDAARPGDWILIAPGDYHERGDRSPAHAPTDEAGAGVMITTPRIHLRGLDRNRVVVDGTLPGSSRCSSAAADQDLGPAGPDGRPLGRNGVEVFKASGVTVENLTACNFLDGAGVAIRLGERLWNEQAHACADERLPDRGRNRVQDHSQTSSLRSSSALHARA